MKGITMTISVLGLQLDQWAGLNLTIQFLLPLLVGLVTTKLTGRKEQFLLLTFLTLVTTVCIQVLQAHDTGAAINLVQILVAAVVNFAVSLLSHYGVWKPTNITELMLATFVKTQPAAAIPAPAPAPVPDPSAPLSPASPVPAPALTLVPPAA